MSLASRLFVGSLSRCEHASSRSGALAGVVLVLAFLVAAVWAVTLVWLPSGQAAAAPPATVQNTEDQAPTQLLTATVFLPLINRPPGNVWLGEYYDNDALSGEPAYTIAGEARIDHDWGGGSPADLPRDHFSVRWTGNWGFELGEYTFFVYADDGVRLWLDDEVLIDAWMLGQGWHLVETSVTEGAHALKLEYFENTGDAGVQIRWRRTDLYPQWQGDYYNNAWVEDTRAFRRTDSVIQFDWGYGCPAGIAHCDIFSVLWTANRLFEPGTHRIYIYADEGYRLYVDGVLKGEGGWYDGQTGGSVDVSYLLEVASLSQHHIRYDFHDRGGQAEARLWIEYLEHPTWTAEFYSNKSLSGTPVVVDSNQEIIYYDWGWGKPKNALPSTDNFSVRWSGDRYFHSGTYRFKMFADDGVRLWVDGELLVDEWHDGAGEYSAPLKYLGTGYHHVVVEYFENTGLAEIRFWWE
jgi:hypothetical protein